jgi:RNA polymerase sigma-70 factor (ECF subfamily)
MRHQNVRNDYFDYVNENSVLSSSNTEEYILYSELQDQAINKLPKAQKEVFVLSRIKGIKYKEIAKKLNVSERTVEVRISQSLKTLRTLLKDFFLLIAVLFVR